MNKKELLDILNRGPWTADAVAAEGDVAIRGLHPQIAVELLNMLREERAELEAKVKQQDVLIAAMKIRERTVVALLREVNDWICPGRLADRIDAALESEDDDDE